MLIKNRKDFYAGVMFVGISSGFGYLAQDYAMGTTDRMGPGYFPTMLAALLGVLGLITLVMSFIPKHSKEPPEKTDWRGLGLVLISVASFALLLPVLGYVVATVALTLIAALASREFSWKTAIVLAAALAVFGITVFGYGLQLQFAILPPFLTN